MRPTKHGLTQYTVTVDMNRVTARLDVMPKTTEQNRIVRTGKFDTEVINNNKKNALEVLYY